MYQNSVLNQWRKEEQIFELFTKFLLESWNRDYYTEKIKWSYGLEEGIKLKGKRENEKLKRVHQSPKEGGKQSTINYGAILSHGRRAAMKEKREEEEETNHG